MPATRISIEHAKENKLFYVVVTVVVYRSADNKCLLLKRSEREKVHPGKYTVPGGKLEWQDLDPRHPSRINGEVLDFEDALEKLAARETKEEAGVDIDIDDFRYIGSNAFIRPDGVPVSMITLAARYKSGEVALQEGDFNDFAWVNGEEAEAYDCIDGIRDQVRLAIKAFSAE